jgi:protein ImuB
MPDRRYLSIWFCHLMTDWFTRLKPAAKDAPFVFAVKQKNREVITFASVDAAALGIAPGMILSDAKIRMPALQVIDTDPDPAQLLHRIALRFIRYSPEVAVDLPDGLLINITGCAHLWGGEEPYYKDMTHRIHSGGYHVRAAIADTPGAAWAFARHLKDPLIVPAGEHRKFLINLPPTALRLSPEILGRLRKLGLAKIQHILNQPRQTLTPRFGKELLLRLDQALGQAEEYLIPVIPPVPYRERLPCLEPVVTAGGIDYALTKLLEALCHRLQREGKGLRTALFQCHRVDHKIIEIPIGTTRATYNITHLFKLFETKLPDIEPAMGIELFTLEAPKVEDASPSQEALWGGPAGVELAELLDRIANKTSADNLARYFPAQHHWPERSYIHVPFDQHTPADAWPTDPRPIHLFDPPEPITVTAPVPDYPPMSFRYRDTLYRVAAANGPTRIENEWWLDNARPRDYYTIEDQDGARYWIFRSGHYHDPQPARWYLHGLFA